MPVLLSEKHPSYQFKKRSLIEIKSDWEVLSFLKKYVDIVLPLIVVISFLFGKMISARSTLFTLTLLALSFVASKQLFSHSHEKKHMRVYGDWTLPAALSLHLLMATFMVIEFHYIDFNPLPKDVQKALLIGGLFTLTASLTLRIMAKKYLGDQWAIHAMGPKRVKNIFILSSGPYRYLRHPIYLSWMLDALAVPMIWGTFFTLVYSFFILVPMYYIRALFEEKASIRRFGWPYLRYMSAVSRFKPSNIFNNRLQKVNVYKTQDNDLPPEDQ